MNTPTLFVRAENGTSVLTDRGSQLRSEVHEAVREVLDNAEAAGVVDLRDFGLVACDAVADLTGNRGILRQAYARRGARTNGA